MRLAAIAIFWIGLALSMALSLGFLAALGSFGFQPAPLIVRILVGLLIVMPFAALIMRAFMQKSTLFYLMAGSCMIVVVVAYATVMLTIKK